MIKKYITLISTIIALHISCVSANEKPEEWASVDSKGNAVAVLKTGKKYRIGWYKNGKSIKRQSLDDTPTRALISKRNNLLVLAYNMGKGASRDKIEIMNEEGVLEKINAGLNSVDSVEQDDTTLLVTSETGKHKLAVYKNGRKSIEKELKTNHFVSSYKSNTRLSKYGDIIFQRPVKSENSTGMKKILYASLDDISNETEISFGEAYISDAIFIDARHYFIAIAGKIIAFSNNRPRWTVGPSVSNIFLSDIQTDSQGRWLLATDARNGIFYVFDKSGNTILHFDPYEKVSEPLYFLEQKFPPDYENPLKTVYPGVKPKFNVALDASGMLVFKIEGDPRVYVIQLNKRELEVEYIETDASLIAYDYISGNSLSKNMLDVQSDYPAKIKILKKKVVSISKSK